MGELNAADFIKHQPTRDRGYYSHRRGLACGLCERDEKIAALEAEVEQLRALVREASPAMMDRREAHPAWMRQAETALARERKRGA